MLLKNLDINISHKGCFLYTDVMIKRDDKFYEVPVVMSYSPDHIKVLSVETINDTIKHFMETCTSIDMKYIVPSEQEIEEMKQKGNKLLTAKQINL